MEDMRIIDLYNSRDERAIAETRRKYGPYCNKIALNLLGSPEEAEEYMAEGHFAPGSMLPKVQAAVEFARSASGRSALITLLEKARDGVAGRTGTVISM